MQNGLGEPEAVKQATEEYRTGEDTIRQFVEQNCFTSQSQPIFAGAQELYDAYKDWVGRNTTDKPESIKEVKDAIEKLGFPCKRNKAGMRYQGIGLRSDRKEDEDPTPDTTTDESIRYSDLREKGVGCVGKSKVFSHAGPREEKHGKNLHHPTPYTKGIDTDGEKAIGTDGNGPVPNRASSPSCPVCKSTALEPYGPNFRCTDCGRAVPGTKGGNHHDQ